MAAIDPKPTFQSTIYHLVDVRISNTSVSNRISGEKTVAKKNDKGYGLSRREFLESSGLTTLALSTGALSGLPAMAAAAQSGAQATGPAGGGPFNILFILTDQERYFGPSALPPGYTLPGRERLKRRAFQAAFGVEFEILLMAEGQILKA